MYFKVGIFYTRSVFTYLPIYVNNYLFIFNFLQNSINKPHGKICYRATYHNMNTSKLSNHNGWSRSIFQ